MKKLFSLLTLTLLVSGVLFAQIRSGTTVWVSSRTADLKSSASFFATSRGSLEMADEVRVLQTDGNWAEVRSAADESLSGWTSISNLSSRRILPSRTGATASEIALAGKGFDRDTEMAYRAQGNLNFADVDRVEAITVSLNELHRFITEGGLSTGD